MVTYNARVTKSLDKDGKTVFKVVSVDLKTPEKGIIDNALFEKAFKYCLEQEVHTRYYSAWSALDKDLKKAGKEATTALKSATKEALEILTTYEKAMATECPTLADSDKKFFKTACLAVLGVPANSKWDGITEVFEACVPALNDIRQDGKKVTPEHLKAVKVAFDTFANNRLATTADSGIFKKYHTEFNDSLAINVLLSLHGKLKWTDKGIDNIVPNMRTFGSQIILASFKKTFAFTPAPATPDRKNYILV